MWNKELIPIPYQGAQSVNFHRNIGFMALTLIHTKLLNCFHWRCPKYYYHHHHNHHHDNNNNNWSRVCSWRLDNCTTPRTTRQPRGHICKVFLIESFSRTFNCPKLPKIVNEEVCRRATIMITMSVNIRTFAEYEEGFTVGEESWLGLKQLAELTKVVVTNVFQCSLIPMLKN